jgi:hypothetical protein
MVWYQVYLEWGAASRRTRLEDASFTDVHGPLVQLESWGEVRRDSLAVGAALRATPCYDLPPRDDRRWAQGPERIHRRVLRTFQRAFYWYQVYEEGSSAWISQPRGLSPW